MTDADKRIEALLERAGCPMMVVKNTEPKSFEDVRRSILRVADEQYDGSLIEYIRDLANTIDRLEGALENVIIERDAAMEKMPKWISVEERLPELMDDGTCDAVLTTDGYFIHMAYFFEGQWYFCDCGEMKEPWSREVTHWMPLPEPPEEQKGEKAE